MLEQATAYLEAQGSKAGNVTATDLGADTPPLCLISSCQLLRERHSSEQHVPEPLMVSMSDTIPVTRSITEELRGGRGRTGADAHVRDPEVA